MDSTEGHTGEDGRSRTGRSEEGSPQPSRVYRGNNRATHLVRPYKREGACPQGSEEAWGEERCTDFSTFSKFPQHRQLEKPIFKNHLLSIMESDSPFYYHLFSQTQWQSVIGFLIWWNWCWRRGMYYLRPQGYVNFAGSQWSTFCVGPYMNEALWGILNEAGEAGGTGKVFGTISPLCLSSLLTKDETCFVSLRERSKNKQSRESADMQL